MFFTRPTSPEVECIQNIKLNKNNQSVKNKTQKTINLKYLLYLRQDGDKKGCKALSLPKK